jgi:hypothetical protein
MSDANTKNTKNKVDESKLPTEKDKEKEKESVTEQNKVTSKYLKKIII